jgi:hypothetical protein
MEEIKQSPLPSKAKIAAKWISILGIFIIIFGIGFLIWMYGLLFTSFTGIGPYCDTLCFIVTLLLPLFIIFIGWFFHLLASKIMERKKWAWWTSEGILSTLLLIWFSGIPFYIFHLNPLFFLGNEIIFMIILPFILLLPPILLLFFDRKNFWKIAT